MGNAVFAILLAAAAPAAIAAATPKEQLLLPPSHAEHFIVISEAGKHGDEWRWDLPGGKTAYRQSILLRGLVFEQDVVVQRNRDGLATGFEIRGVTPTGDAAEEFTVEYAKDRKSTRLNSSHANISYAVFCLK